MVRFWIEAVPLVQKYVADAQGESFGCVLVAGGTLTMTVTLERCSLEFRVVFLQICPVLLLLQYAGTECY